MRRPRLLLLFAALLFATPGSSAEDLARPRLQAALEAMGGEARLRALSSLRIGGIGHWNLMEQSERPTPPWLVMYEQVDEVRDLRQRRLRQKTEGRGAGGRDAWQGATMVLSDGVVGVEMGGQWRPAGGAQLQDMEERLDFAPERVLLTALSASNLRSAPDAVIQDVPHHVLTFSHGQASVRLYLNARTQLPTQVELVAAHPGDIFWSVWGDVRTRLSFQSWTLEQGGLRYPRHWEWERNGGSYHAFTVTRLELDAQLAETDFALPDTVKQSFAARSKSTIEDRPLGRPDRPATELVPGVVHIPGAWDVALVKQDDGLLIIEAPISSGYSARVMEEAQRRFPGVKVKATVSTSDAWPHVGGVREYVARGVPLYVLDINQPLVERVLKAPRTLAPDALAKTPRGSVLRSVGKRMTVGTGTNRVELIPVRTETGERMVFVWFPEHRILYTSDLVQPMPDGSFFNVQQISETVQVAAREKLDVARVFGMHLGATEWSSLPQAVDKVLAPIAGAAP
ncbi:MBL fold metallo-hydrolase [Myxococcus stipitatus]|uniref:MBL fold metallo-hydrolase n=1 Tax=Myxococcus stipitatus TaxID=83455 RepID=UPI0030D3B29C